MSIGVLLIVFGALNELGGIMGFVRAKSSASLIAGGVFGGALIVCGALVVTGTSEAAFPGFLLTLLLCAVFGMRYAKTKKVMPAGMMLGLSVVMAVTLGYLLWV